MKQNKKKKMLITATVVGIILVGSIGTVWYSSVTAQSVDVFEGLSLRERGIEGEGELLFFTEESNDLNLPEVTYHLSKAEGLSNAEEVIITADYNKLDFWMKKVKPQQKTMTYTMQNLLVSDVTWEELPDKEKIYQHVMEVAEQHEQDFLTYLQADAHENLGNHPEVWIDYTFEKAFFGLNDQDTVCGMPNELAESLEAKVPYKKCNNMLIVFKVDKHIQAPYYFLNPGPDYVGFELSSIYTQNGKLVMGVINYDKLTPEYYAGLIYEGNEEVIGNMKQVEF